MVDLWRRICASNANSGGYYGGMMGPYILPGETVLRSWWNIEIYDLAAPVNTYPPGGSMLKAGIVYDTAGLALNDIPSPIAQSFADWLSLSTCPPRIVQFSRATNVAWQINWGFPQDISAKSMRKNTSNEVKALYVSWEFALGADREPGWTVNNWAYSIDTLVRLPPGMAAEDVEVPPEFSGPS